MDCCLKLLHFLPDSKWDQGSFGRFSSQALSFQRCRARSNACRPKRIGNGQLHSFQGAFFFAPGTLHLVYPCLATTSARMVTGFGLVKPLSRKITMQQYNLYNPCYPNTRCHPDPVNQLHLGSACWSADPQNARFHLGLWAIRVQRQSLMANRLRSIQHGKSKPGGATPHLSHLVQLQ